MTINISKTNSKLGASIPSINLPPVITCIKEAPCFKKCYARKGNFRFENVKKSLQNNLDEYRANPDYYFEFIAHETRFFRFFRWHSAGDIVDERYLQGMCDVARKNPDVHYLAFTKKFLLVNGYVHKGNEIPDNLRIVFSGWGKGFEVVNPYNFPTTWVRFAKDEEANSAIPQDAIPCKGKCYECQACWQLHKGQSVYFDEH